MTPSRRGDCDDLGHPLADGPSARALLRLGGLARLSELEMDEQNLYAVRLCIGVDEDPR